MPTSELNKQQNFAKNLRAIQRANGLSLSEFAEWAKVSKSTMQSVLVSGNTTLYTAIRIAEGLGIPLGRLVEGDHFTEHLDGTQHLIQATNWFHDLSSSERDEAINCFQRLMGLISK